MLTLEQQRVHRADMRRDGVGRLHTVEQPLCHLQRVMTEAQRRERRESATDVGEVSQLVMEGEVVGDEEEEIGRQLLHGEGWGLADEMSSINTRRTDATLCEAKDAAVKRERGDDGMILCRSEGVMRCCEEEQGRMARSW
jgi:hypothetical protein